VDITRETPRSGECEECGFDWTIPLEGAIGLVEAAPARVAALFDRAPADAARSEAAGGWSPASYLWHLVDVVRFGMERLWALTLDPAADLPGWNQDAVAAVRRYDELSLPVGMRAFGESVGAWATAAREAPPAATVRHPVLGELTTGDAIRRNAHEAVHHELDIRRGLGLG
jgi:hypothetical protein